VLVNAGEENLQQHMGEPVRMSDLVRHIGLGRTRLRDLFGSVTGLALWNGTNGAFLAK